MRSALLACLLATAAAAETEPPDAGEAVELPESPPSVQDPELAPPPKAPRTLRSWDEALQLIRAQSPDYQATVDNVLRAEGQVRTAVAAVLPNLNWQVSFTHQLLSLVTIPGFTITSPPQDAWTAVGTGGWNVINPRALYGIGTARRGVAAAQSDLSEKRRDLAKSVVASMLGTLAAERIAELNRVGLQAALQRLALADAKLRFKSGTALDLDRAQQDVAAARSLVVTGDESLRQAREGLGLALGSAEPIAAPGDLDLTDFEKSVANTCPLHREVDDRPDVVAARQRLDVAERQVDDVWLQFAPSIAIQSQYAWSSEVLFPPNSTWNVAGVISVPIWDGGARYGLLRQARAAADQAQQALTATRLAAIVNVAQADRAVRVSQASRDLAQRQRDLAVQVDQRVREGYLHGLGTSLDLVSSAQALRQAEINLVLLQFQASQARVFAILANADCAY